MAVIRGFWIVALLMLFPAAALGGKDEDLKEAAQLFKQAEDLEKKGSYAAAVPMAQQLLRFREKWLPSNDGLISEATFLLGRLVSETGDLVQAEALYLRALRIDEGRLGPKHLDISAEYNDLGLLYLDLLQHDRGIDYLQRALRLREELAADSSLIAQTVNNLAAAYVAMGAYSRAEPLYLKAVTLYGRMIPPAPDLATSLNGLATLYHAQGRYAEAEPLLQRALRIREGAGQNQAGLAVVLNGLGSLHEYTGAFEQAEAYYLSALKLMESSSGPDSASAAVIRDNLAGLYDAMQQYQRAIPLHIRALQTREKVLPKGHHRIGESLNNLAHSFQARGQFERAIQAHEQARPILAAHYGARSLTVALSLNNQAKVLHSQGAYEPAQVLYQRALDIFDEASLSTNPRALPIPLSFAELRVAQGKLALALPLLHRAQAMSEQLLRQVRLLGAESRLLSFLQADRETQDAIYSLATRMIGNPDAIRLALRDALQRQGRAQDEASAASFTLRRSATDASVQGSLDRLRELRGRLATLILSEKPPATYRDAQERLKQEASQLENTLMARSLALRTTLSLPDPDRVIQDVATALHKEDVLVTILKYRSHPFNVAGASLEQGWRPSRYLALVLLKDGQLRAADLGPAAEIDATVQQFQMDLRGTSAGTMPLVAAQRLHRLVLGPLQPLLGGRTNLFLALDGALQFVPFAALHDSHDYLLGHYRFTYLTSGRDLLRARSTPATSLLVLADPAFIAAPALFPPVTAQSQAVLAQAAPVLRGLRSLRLDRLAALPETRKEAEQIAAIFPQARLLLGAAATEQALLGAQAPGVLHVATHGLFLEDVPSLGSPVATVRRVVATGGAGDPLLRSALVMAGAKTLRRPALSEASSESDGLATALEVSGMDLWGTQLVDAGRIGRRVGGGIKRGDEQPEGEGYRSNSPAERNPARLNTPSENSSRISAARPDHSGRLGWMEQERTGAEAGGRLADDQLVARAMATQRAKAADGGAGERGQRPGGRSAHGVAGCPAAWGAGEVQCGAGRPVDRFGV